MNNSLNFTLVGIYLGVESLHAEVVTENTIIPVIGSTLRIEVHDGNYSRREYQVISIYYDLVYQEIKILVKQL